MEYKLYKLNFKTAIHIGKQHLSDAEQVITADVLFSALCKEALMMEGEQGILELVHLAKSGKFRISDCFPYNKENYYMPKPMTEINGDRESDSNLKKQFKKLKYVNADKLEQYLQGTLDVAEENEILKEMGHTQIRTMAAVNEGQDARPFSVGAYHFEKDWGLWFLVAYDEEETLWKVEDLLLSLESTGIGGKTSSGMGKFILENGTVSPALERRLNLNAEGSRYMTLSISMCNEEELEHILQDAEYSLVKKSGFISSETYAKTLQRKKDFFMFRAGATFTKTFDGVIADVAAGGNHPVYRYGMPIFVEVQS